jgi:hypothetical protein
VVGLDLVNGMKWDLSCWGDLCTALPQPPPQPQPNRIQSSDTASVVSVDEAVMTVTTPAGLTQRALLEYLANYRWADGCV